MMESSDCQPKHSLDRDSPFSSSRSDDTQESNTVVNEDCANSISSMYPSTEVTDLRCTSRARPLSSSPNAVCDDFASECAETTAPTDTNIACMFNSTDTSLTNPAAMLLSTGIASNLAAFHYQMSNYRLFMQQAGALAAAVAAAPTSTASNASNGYALSSNQSVVNNGLFNNSETASNALCSPLNLSVNTRLSTPTLKVEEIANRKRKASIVQPLEELRTKWQKCTPRSESQCSDDIQTLLIEDGNIVVSSTSKVATLYSPTNATESLNANDQASVGSDAMAEGVNSAVLTCIVCGDMSSGKHYGIQACNGCSGFFKRSVRRKLIYRCQAGNGCCLIDKQHRNQCQACRLKKCLKMGMNRDAVQNERQPRNTATIRPETLGGDGERLIRQGVASSAVPTAYFSESQQSGCRNTTNIKERKCAKNNELVNSEHKWPKIKGELSDLCSGYSSSARVASSSSCSTNSLTSCGNGVKSKKNVKITSSHPVAIFHPIMADSIYETCTRLLYMAIKWAKSLPAFASLTFVDQIALLEVSWSELFLLCAIQWCLPFESTPLFTPNEERTQDENNNTNNNNDNNTNNNNSSSSTDFEVLEGNRKTIFSASIKEHENATYIRDVKNLHEIASKFKQVAVDGAEFACLKALSLFRPETKELKDAARVETMQDQAQIMLLEHEKVNSSNSPTRFGKLLLLLASLRLVVPEKIAKIYFHKLIANGSMEKMLFDMFNC